MARQTDDSGPNLLGEKGVQEKPELGIRSPVKKGTPRGTLQKIPQRVLTDLRRRIAEVKFAEAVIKAGDKMDPDAAIKEASKKKYGGLIDSTRINKIHADPNKFIKQLGVDPTNLKTGEKLPSVSDLRKYVRNSLDNVEAQVGRLNKHLFPEGVPLDHIVRSIHFGHGQALGSAGPHVGDEGLAQLPMENIGQGKLSGPSKGELDLGTGRYKVNDAYSAIGHSQFWDEVLSNFIMGRKHVPVLVELTPEGKNRVIHQGHDPDRVIIEEGEIKLRDAVTGEPKVRVEVDPASKADPLYDYGRTHQPGVLESSERNLTRQRPQEIVEHKPKVYSAEDANEMRDWLRDQDIDGKYKTEVTEYGKGMGGVRSTIQSRTEQISQLLNPQGTRVSLNKATRSLRTADRTANLATVLATGTNTDRVIAGTQFTVAQAITDPKVQAQLGKQLTKLVGEYGAGRVAKLLPGIDILLSQIEAGNYMAEGRWDQATRAMVSGAIGWIPLLGDGASAILDAQNTYDDIERLIRMHHDPNYDWEAEFERNPQLTSPKEAAAAMSERKLGFGPSGFEWQDPEITPEDRLEALNTDTPIPASILKEMDLQRQHETFFKPKPEENLQSRLQSNNNFLNTLVA